MVRESRVERKDLAKVSSVMVDRGGCSWSEGERFCGGLCASLQQGMEF